jgi:folate-dependent phosphoribosylglycinamide formyltransferase PurN
MGAKVVVISPNPQSLYTTSVCDLLLKSGIEIQAVFVKNFSFTRFKDEFSRDGFRLVKKIWKKLILKTKAYQNIEEHDNILNFRASNGISIKNVNELVSQGTRIHYLDDINSSHVEQLLKIYNTDLIVFTGGGMIKENILKHSGAGVINCHMGVLPMYRGMDVVEWPLLHKDFNNIGVTLHFMAKGVDTGDVLRISKIQLKPMDTIKNLRIRFEPIMVIEMVDVVIKYLSGEIIPQKQKIKDGKQFFIMDDDLINVAESNLMKHTLNL